MSDDSLRSSLGAQLRALRISGGLTQERLAEHLGVTPRYLAGIERGERNLTMDTVDALAQQLDAHVAITMSADASA